MGYWRTSKILQPTIPFGKYKGEYIGDICNEDPDYIDWLYESLDDDDWLKKKIYEICFKFKKRETDK
jgi:uncharacterized protein (DUF3820 family)